MAYDIGSGSSLRYIRNMTDHDQDHDSVKESESQTKSL